MALNPIPFTREVTEQFRRYQLTAFPIADPNLAAQARALLGAGAFRASPLAKGPYVSLARAFLPGAALADLAAEGAIHPALATVAEYPSLFAHQEKTLRAVLAGKHVLISTGTGSGKTESFLYPIVDHCLRLRDDKAQAGVAAILVYPMNALAADQRDRLRTLLAGTGITYGMWTGATPETPARADVRRLPEGSDRAALLAARKRKRRNDADPVPWEECASESEIRERHPRILITNSNQLELLLTRPRDFELFGDALRFIVLDEAHTYSGATGAEVACLVRRLRAFAGKDPGEVTCIATSATITDPESAPELAPAFLSRLCGVPESDVELIAEEYEPLAWPGKRSIPAEPADPEGLLARVLAALGSAHGDEEDEEAGVDVDALAACVEELTGDRPSLPSGGVAEALYEHLAAQEPVRVLAEELEHPRDLAWVTQRLRERLGRTGPAPEAAQAELLAYLALAAFARRGDAPLLRPKLHVFVRGLEGAVVTWDGDPPAPVLHFSAAEALGPTGDERQPTAVFPLSVCRTCGQHYATAHVHDIGWEGGEPTGGEAAGDSALWRPAADPAADGVGRVRFTDSFVVEADADEGGSRKRGSRRLDDNRVEAWLCTGCGAIHRGPQESCANEDCGRRGPLARIWIVPEREEGFRCAGCGERSRRIGGRTVEPIRPLKATTVADVHILAQEMISAAGSDDERHLLIFADNRQDAAFQAGWMRDHARRYRLRYLILERLRDLEAKASPVSLSDLHAALLDAIDADRSLARVLAPEVFESAGADAFGHGVRERLSRFLRMQLLRELATSFPQRDSLERWGQLRVEYFGLDADSERVRETAARIGLSPVETVAAAASLLDYWRRRQMLWDADEPIFSRWYRDGDPEIQRGYLPSGFTERRPAGLKLAREGGEEDKWVNPVLAGRGRTAVEDLLRKAGVDDYRAGAEAIWELVSDLELVRPVKLVGANDKALAGTAGAHQVDSGRIGLVTQSERWICSACRRVHARATPGGACTKAHCTGVVSRSDPPTDDYNVSLLTRPFAMVTAEEHTAQVPQDRREEIEKEFKRPGGTVNTLVATPTLELGVDIGALDLVLCRNVPPTAANYWQRVGRAGRRRRMAVIYVYCRNAVHDAYFSADPERLLGAPVRPPRFNLRNDVLVVKHVHAAVLSELLKIGAGDPAVADQLAAALPQYVADWLFEGEERRYRTEPADVSGFAALVDSHRGALVAAVKRVFAAGWPSEAAAEVASERLEELVAQTPAALGAVVKRLWERLQWVLRTQERLIGQQARRVLTPEEERQLGRCRSYIAGLREFVLRNYTLSVLAAEGFLPGYGLYDGGVTAFPGRQGAGQSFELSRPPAVALREFVPGNLLYANRGRFRPSFYHLKVTGEGPASEEYVFDPESGWIARAGDPTPGYAGAETEVLPGLTIADVDLAHLSPIRDEEVDRFQMPVTVLGMALRHRRGGVTYTLGSTAVHHVLGQGLRLVNVGPADRVRAGEPGFPLCTVCGAARSPYASARELDDFATWHQDKCGRKPERVAFSADVVADALHFQDLDSLADAVNVGEALRLGAAQVLEMEPEDLHVLTVPRGDGERHDLYLYDPMPGGSGLLSQVLERWPEVAGAVRVLLEDCPNACETSCYGCLRTGRNVFHHRFLDRRRGLELFEGFGATPEAGHTLSPLEDAALTAGLAETTNKAEDRLRDLLERAGLEGAVGQHEIALGEPYKRTVPDFAWPDERVAVYLDGLSRGIHGSEARARADQIIRDQLEDRDWTVVSIAASHLDDPTLLRLDFRRVARALGRRDVAERLQESDEWLRPDGADAEENGHAPAGRWIPVYSIRAAAGKFLENEAGEVEGWVPVGDALPSGEVFAVRIEGRSMEPRIRDGDLALFVSSSGGGALAGSRQGKIVLAQLHSATDPEGGGSYTVKRYRSEKKAGDEGEWEHSRVVLESLNPEVEDIEVERDDEVTVFAEFLHTLPDARVQSEKPMADEVSG